MSKAERLKWESRYASCSYSKSSFAPASPWVMMWVSRLRPGRALDLAMGLGSNAIFLASLGFQVYGIDISFSGVKIARNRALSSNLTLNVFVADLDVYPLRPNYFDLVVDCYYLNKSLFPAIKASLRPGGHVIIETYVEDSGAKLLKPSYLLKPKELQRVFRDFDVISYEETETNLQERKAGHSQKAHFCARRPDPQGSYQSEDRT
jgi:tellurite methyltransferase